MQSYEVKIPCVNSGWQRTCSRICCIVLPHSTITNIYMCFLFFSAFLMMRRLQLKEYVNHFFVESVLVRVTDWSCFAMVGWWFRALEAIAECKALKMQGALVTYTKAINMLDKSSLDFAKAYLYF